MVLLRDPSRDRQTKPRPARLRRHEGLEELSFRGTAKAGSVVANFDDDFVLAPLDADKDRLRLARRCLDCVLHEVA
jgi:hypothetical protein